MFHKRLAAVMFVVFIQSVIIGVNLLSLRNIIETNHYLTLRVEMLEKTVYANIH